MRSAKIARKETTMMQHGKLVAIVIELLGIAIGSTGIGVEVATGAEIGYVLITIGAVLVASGGVIWAKMYKWLK